ncbi:MAG TPA: TetR/AcrR family transcriptional regulator [Gemmatimonadales bacterium]
MSAATAVARYRRFAATGVDLVVRESGVAKMTLYRHFPSKDALIAGWLERVDAQFWESFERWAGPADAAPRDRVIGVFRGLQQLVGGMPGLPIPPGRRGVPGAGDAGA